MPDLVDRGLVPRVQEHDGRRHQLIGGEALSVAVGGDHVGQEIIGRSAPPLLDEAQHVFRELARRAVRVDLVGFGAAGPGAGR